MKVNFSKENLKAYYLDDFSKNLKNYFKITEWQGKSFILHVDQKSNPGQRPQNPASDKEKNFYFSGIFVMMVITWQSIYTIGGVDAENAFRYSSGWPRISAGLDGPMFEPYNMLLEASLLPYGAEIKPYLELLDIVSDFIKSEIHDFITNINTPNLNHSQHSLLIELFKGKEQNLMALMDEKVQDLKITLITKDN